MNLLITGGAGYIGSVITDLALQHSYKVRVIDTLWFKKDVPLIHSKNTNYEFVKGDICDVVLAREILENVDFVIHACAVVGNPASKKFPNLAYKINYEASVNLINLAQEYGINGLIFFSTCSNYGISEGLADEKTALRPLSLYAKTKVNVENYLMDEVNNLNWITCRLATVYGVSPRMRFDLTVNDFTMTSYMKKHLEIYLPKTHRPYIHVYDVARVVLQLIENFQTLKNNVLNVGFNGENYKKIQISKIVKNFMPDTKIEIAKDGNDLRDYQVDFSKLQRFLSIRNKFTVKDGVKEILRLFKDKIIIDPYESCFYNTTPDFGK